MHFSYQDPIDRGRLSQGDLLERTAELTQLIRQVHPHFERADNIFFLVLTQSCDLVPSHLKTDYIAICPVRTLTSVLNKALPNYVREQIGQIPIGVEREKGKYKLFLERLFNNNEHGYFFLDQTDAPLGEDSCALTKLSISLKSEHYELCLRAKALQLSETFQAKLGWLVGNIYSRVGTQDYSPSALKEKVDRALQLTTAWVPTERDRKEVIDHVKNNGVEFDPASVVEILKSKPTNKERALDVVKRVLEGSNVDQATTTELLKKLRNDPELAQVFPK